MRALKKKQRGVTLTGLIVFSIVLIVVGAFAMKLVPSYIHSAQISQIFKDISADSTLQNATIKEIKDSYSKRIAIEQITEITAEDIEIEKDGSTLVLSANYTVKIPLVANITLLLEFNPSSS